eukprot:m.309445 g.309445  ORF g.309445 m.309445 type:complete len:369 (+) comp19639_c0_seq10:1595-2701(+)
MVACWRCGAAGDSTTAELRRCSRCKQALYCDSTCQRAHWPEHKRTCTKPTQSTATPVPVPELTVQKVVWEGVGCAKAKGNGKGKGKAAGGKCGGCGGCRARNLVVWLHGCGDTEQRLAKTAATMALPQTDSLSVRAPLTVPLVGGHEWYPSFEADGRMIEGVPGETRRLRQLARVRAALHRLVATEVQGRGWTHWQRVFFVGVGQGAVVALDAALSAPCLTGGAVAISGGCMLPEAHCPPASSDQAGTASTVELAHAATSTAVPSLERGLLWRQPDTPVLVTHGIRDQLMPITDARASFERLQAWLSPAACATWHQYDRGFGAFASPAESRDFHTFISSKLDLRQATLEEMSKDPDSTLIEITPPTRH